MVRQLPCYGSPLFLQWHWHLFQVSSCQIDEVTLINNTFIDRKNRVVISSVINLSTSQGNKLAATILHREGRMVMVVMGSVDGILTQKRIMVQFGSIKSIPIRYSYPFDLSDPDITFIILFLQYWSQINFGWSEQWTCRQWLSVYMLTMCNTRSVLNTLHQQSHQGIRE